MNVYEQLPTNFLIDLYYGILKNIESGSLSKNMYYELGLMSLVASQRGLKLCRPADYEQIVTQRDFDEFIQSCG